MEKYSYSVEELSKTEKPSIITINDFNGFKLLLEKLSKTASTNTHYDKLDEWSEQVYKYVHTMLEKNGFVNGDVEANKGNVDANFWFSIYGVVSSVIYSPHFKTKVAPHHSSAWERNEALKKEINDVQTFLMK